MSVAPGHITIIGLGPGNPDLRTVGTQRALDTSEVIVLRTRVHPGLADLADDPRVIDCDDCYQRGASFADVYSEIANRVLALAAGGKRVVYAVPGHPRFAERTVQLIEERASQLSIGVDLLDAVSFVDVVVSSIGVDPVSGGFQLIDAAFLAEVVEAEPFGAGLLGIDPARPVLLAQLYRPEIATAVKLALGRIYPDDHPVTLLQASKDHGTQSSRTFPLHALDRQTPDYLTSLWVPALPPLEVFRDPQTLLRIVARLRAPGGCPWDREQTPQSMRNAILEEAYETVAAIDEGDHAELSEELGDLLLLVAMQAQMAEEAGDFVFEDVVEAITRKLIRRHPHVFGDVSAATPDAVISTWEAVKATERAAKGEDKAKKHRIDRLPRAMPATRKVVEMLAPRATFSPPADAAAGDQLLNSVLSLIDNEIDPELALEAALRQRVLADEEQSIASVAVTDARKRQV